MPEVSVIIPTYNRADLISEAIESVLAQTFTDFELIVVDDGSTDHTGEVVTAFKDSRLSYHRQEKLERGAARNKGVALSRGEYITFLDDDDWYMPDKLAVQVPVLQAQPEAGMVISGWDRIKESGEIVRSERPWVRNPNPALEDWLFEAMAHVAAILIRRSWFDRVGGFDPTMAPNEDTYLWYRLAEAGCPITWVKKMVFRQRMHDDNSVRNLDRVKKGKLAMLKAIYADPDSPPALSMPRDDAYARVYFGFACLEFAAGKVDRARADLSHAVQLDPSFLANHANRFLEVIAAYAWNHLTPAPGVFTNCVFSNLPDDLADLRGLRRSAMARTWMVGAFRAFQVNDMVETRRRAIRALVTSPSLLRNRGLVSILARAWIRPVR